MLWLFFRPVSFTAPLSFWNSYVDKAQRRNFTLLEITRIHKVQSDKHLKMQMHQGSFNNYVDQILPNCNHLPPHYSRFGFGLFKICMHLKTVQMSFFAIKINISIHISSLKKVLKIWKLKKNNPHFTFFGHFLPCTNLAPHTSRIGF